MREISTKKIEIGEHVLIDGVEYVAKEMKSANAIPCLRCDLDDSKHSCAGVSCGGAYLKEVKKATEEEDNDTPMTNHELAEWLSKGNGQYRFRGESAEGSFWTVYEDEEDLAVDSVLIRPWGTDEWVKPTLEIYERDCR